MKYTIEGFSQLEAINLERDNKRIDVIDLVILRWITDFHPKMTKKIIDDEEYFWINYQVLLEQMPILSLSKRSLYDRLQKMCFLELLEHKHIKEKGNFSYYKFGRKYINLVMNLTSEDMKQTSEPSEVNFQTLQKQTSEQNNSSIINTNLLNTHLLYSKKNTKESFDEFWKLYPKHKDKAKAKLWFERNKPNQELMDKILSALKKQKESDDWKKDNGKFIPYPTTWLNGKRWEDEEFDSDEELDKLLQEGLKARGMTCQ